MNQELSQIEQRERFRRMVEDVVSNTDLVELIEPFIEGGLRQQGQSFVGLCPFHSDSNPSLSVTPSKGVYRCWSCDAGLNGSSGGNAITFVRRYFNKSFRESCEYLAERLGVDLGPSRRALQRGGIPTIGGAGSKTFSNGLSIQQMAAQRAAQRPPIDRTPRYETSEQQQLEAIRDANTAFVRSFISNKQAQDYLFKQRGISTELAKRFSFGFAPKTFDFLSEHFSNYHGNKALEEAGLIKASSKNAEHFYDVFRDRVLFGVRDEKGEVVGFGGRLLNDDTFIDKNTGKTISTPKYLNSPESAVFKKSELLFGFYEAKDEIAKQNQALVVEGYMDVLGLASHGVDHAVACMGVAVSDVHVKDLTKHAKHLVMCFDGDRAGRQGAARSLQGILPNYNDEIEVRFLLLPEGLDPDDYIKQNGRAAFDQLIENARSLPEFIDVALSDIEQAALNDTAEHSQSAEDRQLSMLKRWTQLAPEGSRVRWQLSQKTIELMRSQAVAPDSKEGPSSSVHTYSTPQTRSFSRQGEPTSPSLVGRNVGLSVEQRITEALNNAPIAALAKRESLAVALSAVRDEDYDALCAWVDWYDRALSLLQPTTSEDCPEAAKLISVIDRVMSFSAAQGVVPNEDHLNLTEKMKG